MVEGARDPLGGSHRSRAFGTSSGMTERTPSLRIPSQRTVGGLAAAALLAAGVFSAGAAARGAAAPDPAAFFTRDVKPVLAARCVACHSGDKPQAGLRLTSREAVLKGGASGPAVSLAKPAESLLVAAIHYQGRRMPPQGRLPQKEIDLLTNWVGMGLPWATGEAGRLEPTAHAGPPQVTPEAMKFWSFQPVRRPAVPAVPAEWKSRGTEARKNGPGRAEPPLFHSSTLPLSPKAWARNPIDAFILKGLSGAGLLPNPEADRAALLRRAYYDLTGLPPSPAAVRAFLADDSPQAWEKVVDRLLASPQYGEKWGRHWLDLVRYAESNSYERDGTKPFAWRYRDYVIRCFNEDRPYDRFVMEQLAGDELENGRVEEWGNGGRGTPVAHSPTLPLPLSSRAERLIATGYYRLGIWQDEPVDPEQELYEDLDDIASTTAQVFLGLTMGCARCHDHKLDPLPQRDYYRFLAFFSGVRRYGVRSEESVADASLRSIASPEENRKQQALVDAHQAKVKANEDAIEGIERPVLADLTPVEKQDWANPAVRLGIVRKRVPALLAQTQLDEYRGLLEKRRDLRQSAPRALDMALCVTEIGATPREMHVLARGSAQAPGEKVEPGFPSVLNPPAPLIASPASGESCGRRLALARWVASAENPLTARVMANRIWQYHFGRGLVRSSSNFGFHGDRPTHPELLDWLADELVSNGWHLKPLHRLIMLSSAYQMSSRADRAGMAKDPENNLFWRFDMRRLAAEEVRDSILAANGSLNLEMGGPSIYPTIPAAVLAGQSVPGANWGRSTPEQQCRRSVYIFVKRSLMTPLLQSFDGPEPDFTCPVRFATTQPTQALGMLNSEWLQDQGRVFARYLPKEAGAEPADQVRLALWRVLQRDPTAAEVDRGVRFLAAAREKEKASAEDALAAFCVLALNLNEFMYLD